MANTRPMYSRPTEGSTGWMMIRNAPASARGRNRDGEGDALDLDRIGGHQLQRQLILRHGHDRAAGERTRKVELKQPDHQERHDAGNHDAERQVEETVMHVYSM